MLDPWGSIATFISNALPNSHLKSISITLIWNMPRSKEIVDLENERGIVLRNAEALEPILKGVLTLDLDLWLQWPSELYDEYDHIRIKFPQSAVEEGMRKFSKLSEKASLYVAVGNYFE